MEPHINPFHVSVYDLVPAYKDIPAQYKQTFNSKCRGMQLACDWFFRGVKNLVVVMKPGIDKGQAIFHLETILGSWVIPHEHKEAAVAYLIESWFDSFDWEPFNEREYPILIGSHLMNENIRSGIRVVHTENGRTGICKMTKNIKRTDQSDEPLALVKWDKWVTGWELISRLRAN